MKVTRFFAVLLMCVLAFSIFPSASVNAAQIEGDLSIQPRWSNTEDVIVSLTFTGTTANCSAIVSGMPGTTKINATVTLERKVNGTYTAVKTWSNQSVSGATLGFGETYSVTKGYTYRLKITANVTRNGVTETVSNYVESNL